MLNDRKHYNMGPKPMCTWTAILRETRQNTKYTQINSNTARRRQKKEEKRTKVFKQIKSGNVLYK